MKGICPYCDDNGCEECTGKEKEMNETDFRNAQVGDRVWDVVLGHGSIEKIKGDSSSYPIVVLFDNDTREIYTVDGKVTMEYNRTLFWSEVQITPPPRPKRKKKVEIVRYANIYKNPRGMDSYQACIYQTEEDAEMYKASDRIVIVKVPIAFEVEE